jgi:hypothetical protein
VLGTYNTKFVLPNGREVFVPSASGRLAGAEVHRRVLTEWRKPDFYFHLRSGGHVAALRWHSRSEVFAMLDIRGFFDSVTRSKTHRSLCGIGFPHRDAWKIAQEATVEKAVGGFSLPYGFIQSPVLASLALDRSALGRRLRAVARSRVVRLTTYMDDIVLSGLDEAEVQRERAALVEAAGIANFEINDIKSQPTGAAIVAFNIVLSHGSLMITDARMDDFEDDVLRLDANAVVAIIGYVRGVNRSQSDHLIRVGTDSPNPSVRAAMAGLLAAAS